MASKGIHRVRSSLPASKLGAGGHPQPSIVFTDPQRDEGYVSSWTLAVLGSLMTAAGVTRVYITFTYRSPRDQARVMLGNLTPGKSMYAGYGRRIEKVAQNIALMDEVLSAVSESMQESGFAVTPYKKRSKDRGDARCSGRSRQNNNLPKFGSRLGQEAFCTDGSQ